jgi:hypothetical protein
LQIISELVAAQYSGGSRQPDTDPLRGRYALPLPEFINPTVTFRNISHGFYCLT